MANFFKKACDEQRKRLLEKLSATEPGTQEYRELQAQLGAYDIMDEKRASGRIAPTDWLKFGATVATTAIVVTADQWIPAVASKLRLSEVATKLLK